MNHQKKSKYKGSSGKRSSEAKFNHPSHDDSEDRKFNKRAIVDNSSKYVSGSESEDDAPDFDYLMKLPAGSHFLLKSEIEKYHDDCQQSNTQFSKYFNINTNLLNSALKSIPFNERHSCIDVNWNSDEIIAMQDVARSDEEQYRILIEKLIDEKSGKPIHEVSKDIKIAKPPETTIQEAPSIANDKESMTKWLDDILDL